MKDIVEEIKRTSTEIIFLTKGGVEISLPRYMLNMLCIQPSGGTAKLSFNKGCSSCGDNINRGNVNP
jgi:hypothetical protein